MVRDSQEGRPDRRASTDHVPERRQEARLPEELTAVITESVVASTLFGRLPDEQRHREAQWVAGGKDRSGRARRAVEVVRRALRRRP